MSVALDKKKINVLLVEDNPADYRYIQRMLEQATGKSSFQTVVAQRLDEGLAVLAQDKIDIILLDLGLPDSSGIDTLKKTQSCETQVPIVVLTGLADDELAETAVREHAQDYLVKGRVDGDLLVRSIRYAIERKRAELALRKQEEEYRSLFEESKDVVFSISPDGKLLDINPAGVDLFGFASKEEMQAADLAQVIFEDTADLERLFDAVSKKGYVSEIELPMKRISGEPITTIITCNALTDKNGRIVSLRGIMHDITTHRKLEQQLIQSHKMESIGRLAGGVAHDLNNFLTAGMGYIDLARIQSDDEEQTWEDLREARTAIDHAVDLTKQLLLFSRREPPALKTVDLNETVEKLLKMLGRVIGENYSLIANLGANPSAVRADPGHLEQVLMNLVVNARDAMPGGGEIFIKTGNRTLDEGAAGRPEAHAGRYIILAVADRGVGMDAETVSHIFEPFYSTKSTGKGTGLGLSVVFGVVAQHGGWIEVESNPGQGSRFEVFLPLATEGLDKLEGEAASVQGLRGRGEKVLIVEDERMVRLMANRMLSGSGYQVITAGSASEAHEVFDREGDIHVVFCDVVLPDRDGISLVKELRKRAPGIKAIFTSGYSKQDHLEELRAEGDAFLMKPYSLPQLLELLRNVIEKKQGG